MTAPDQLGAADLVVDFEVTGPDLDALLAAIRRDLAKLLGPDRHVADAEILIGVEQAVGDYSGTGGVVEWNATVTGHVFDGPAPDRLAVLEAAGAKLIADSRGPLPFDARECQQALGRMINEYTWAHEGRGG